jgi:hypothetical protein
VRVVSRAALDGRPLPRFGEPQLLVDAAGRGHLARLACAWDPNSFGNTAPSAFVGPNAGLYRTIQYNNKNGIGSNALREPLADVIAAINALVAENPLYLKSLNGAATDAEMVALFDTLRPWDDKLVGAHAGAVYVLVYRHPKITVSRLEGQLAAAEFDCVGMGAIRDSLAAQLMARGGADVAVVTNAGETTDGGRPALHVGDKTGGNALPRALSVAFNELEPGSVTAARSIRTAWTSAGCGLDANAACQRRMLVEALLDVFLHTQQGPSDALRAKAGGGVARTKGVHLVGSNFISGGASVGDPLRAASRMQSGAQGGQLLSALIRDPFNTVAVYFLVDRLGALDPPVARDAALAMTAKAAYAKYVGSLAKTFEARRAQFRAAGASADDMEELEAVLVKVSRQNAEAGEAGRPLRRARPTRPSSLRALHHGGAPRRGTLRERALGLFL